MALGVSQPTQDARSGKYDQYDRESERDTPQRRSYDRYSDNEDDSYRDSRDSRDRDRSNDRDRDDGYYDRDRDRDSGGSYGYRGRGRGRYGRGGYRGRGRGGRGGHVRRSSNISVCDHRERGQVVIIRGSFGFIRCLERDGQMFFHLSNILPDSDGNRVRIEPGDDVEFLVETDLDNDRQAAVDIELLEPGSVQFEELLEDEGRLSAVVVHGLDRPRGGREPKGGLVRVLEEDEDPRSDDPGQGEELQFSGRDLLTPESDLQPGDLVEVSVFREMRTGKRGATQIGLVQTSTEGREQGVVGSVHSKGYASAPAYGFLQCADRSNQNLFFHFSELLDTEYMPKPGDGVEFRVQIDRNGKECAARIVNIPRKDVQFSKIEKQILSGRVKQGLRQTNRRPARGRGGGAGSSIGRLSGGLIALDLTSLSSDGVGREVEMLSFEIRDLLHTRDKLSPGDVVEFQLAVHKPTGKRHATNIAVVEKAEQKTERGVVNFVRQRDYGFIDRESVASNLYFRWSDGPSGGVRVGDCVEFREDTDGSGKPCAVDIKTLPKGSVKFFEVDAKLRRGCVSTTPGKDRDGEIKFQRSTKSDRVDSESSAVFVDMETIPFSGKNFARGFKFEVQNGDEVEFKITTDLRVSPPRRFASNIMFKAPCADGRAMGVVVQAWMDREYGFLACARHPAGLFFHYSDVMSHKGGAKWRGPRPGDEFSFNESSESRPGSRPRAKASRLIQLDAGASKLDDVGEEWLMGKIESTDKRDRQSALVGCLQFVNDSGETAELGFRAGDANCRLALLRKYDIVTFRLATATYGKKEQRATQIKIVPKGGKVTSVTDKLVSVECAGTQEKFTYRVQISSKSTKSEPGESSPTTDQKDPPAGRKGFAVEDSVMFDVGVVPGGRRALTRRAAVRLRKADFNMEIKGVLRNHCTLRDPNSPISPKSITPTAAASRNSATGSTASRNSGTGRLASRNTGQGRTAKGPEGRGFGAAAELFVDDDSDSLEESLKEVIE
eukprot:1004035_1